jgi:GNAT superfamily N-acetyltransferase
VIVRFVTPADWKAVAALLAELGRPAVLAAEDEEVHRDFFEKYLEREDAVGLVAVSDAGDVVGFCDLEFRQRLAFRQPQAWIPDLIVKKDMRSRGAGAALLARAEELARARGCWGIELESAMWRERAHSFYRREGWAESGKSFTKNLTGEQWPPAPRD